MIFYFSGTGNSQWAAKRLGAATGDALVSINELLKGGGQSTFRSDRPLVFVVPTYAWRMPRVVERWLRETRFEGSRDAYFILTCGGGCGNAAAYAKRLCAEKGLRFRGLAPVLMPENYLALYPTPGKEECETLLARAEPRLAALAGQLQKGEPFSDSPTTFRDRLQSGPVNLLFYPLVVRDKAFTVSGGCISCGKCAQRCPLNNIALVDGRPVWKGNCTHCMACIGGCPVGAIEYGTKSAGRRRYYIMEDPHPQERKAGPA